MNDVSKILNWLAYLFYKVGNQNYDFSLQILSKEGFVSKRRPYSKVCFDYENSSNIWFLKRVNQRQQLPIELILDIEEKQKLKPIVQELTNKKSKFYVFSTGSRGYHIHIFFTRELSETEKLRLIRHFGADTQLSSNRHMVALEFAEHFKSGKIKDLVNAEEILKNGN